MDIVCLGTGDAFSAGGRHQAAYLVRNAGSALLLDCGPHMLASLKRHNLSPAPIDTILISHFHGDHFAGLPFLFLEYIYVEPRLRPLKIVGPPGVENRVLQLFRAMYADSAAEPLPYELQFVEAQPGKPLTLGDFRAEAFRVPHQEDPPSYGYAVESGGKKIVYTGDTGWSEDLPAHTAGADLFLCECSFFETRIAMHLDYPRIAENLNRFGAKRIVLTHLGQEVLERMSDVELETARDGLVVSL
jgi:ribonuclease BN (tRNA processing enzyme)